MSPPKAAPSYCLYANAMGMDAKLGAAGLLSPPPFRTVRTTTAEPCAPPSPPANNTGPEPQYVAKTAAVSRHGRLSVRRRCSRGWRPPAPRSSMPLRPSRLLPTAAHRDAGSRRRRAVPAARKNSCGQLQPGPPPPSQLHRRVRHLPHAPDVYPRRPCSRRVRHCRMPPPSPLLHAARAQGHGPMSHIRPRR